MSRCCAHCSCFNSYDTNSYGEGWCGYFRAYYSGSDSACSHFTGSDDDWCYLTTVTVSCLGYPDDCIYLNTLRAFRDDVMKQTPQWIPLLEEYQIVGPIISHKIANDNDKLQIATNLFETYIKPVCNLVNARKFDEAVELYKQMVFELKARYNLY